MCKEADSVVCKKESVDGSKTIQSEVNLDQHFTSSFFDNYCKLVMTRLRIVMHLKRFTT